MAPNTATKLATPAVVSCWTALPSPGQSVGGLMRLHTSANMLASAAASTLTRQGPTAVVG